MLEVYFVHGIFFYKFKIIYNCATQIDYCKSTIKNIKVTLLSFLPFCCRIEFRFSSIVYRTVKYFNQSTFSGHDSPKKKSPIEMGPVS